MNRDAIKNDNMAVYLFVIPKYLLNLHVKKGGIHATIVSHRIDRQKLNITFFKVLISPFIIYFLFLDKAGSKFAIIWIFITFIIIYLNFNAAY
jgi:hypothetical protein